jgi:hypothetical protein
MVLSRAAVSFDDTSSLTETRLSQSDTLLFDTYTSLTVCSMHIDQSTLQL